MIVDPAQTPDATVLIVTKNRKDDLRKCLRAVMEQTAAIEVLVVDDASTDGTPEMLAAEFPQVRVHRRDTSAGCVVNRNVGAELARAPVILSIDDDATFQSADTIELTLNDFSDPVIAAVAMPMREANKGDVVFQQPPDADIWVSHRFIGAIHALRRDAFLQMGGFRGALVHFGEEEELCLRMLDAGYVARLGTAPPGFHDHSPVRNRVRERYYASRNAIYWNWMNAPGGAVWLRMLFGTARELAYAAKHRMPWSTLRGLVAGYRESFFGPAKRRPVSKETWDLWRELHAHGPRRLRDIRHRLPKVPPVPVEAPSLAESRSN